MKELVSTRFSWMFLCSIAFGIIVTGSSDVINNCLYHGLLCIKCKRTPVYRGKYIREAYKNGMEK